MDKHVPHTYIIYICITYSNLPDITKIKKADGIRR